jgi:hypothetical protein
MQLLFNARVYPLDRSGRQASAVAIDRGRILDVGDSDTLCTRYDIACGAWSSVEKIDLQGRTVIPGLVDAHLHLMQYALGLEKIDCETSSKALCLQRVTERAGSTPPDRWILGHGWNQNTWPEGWGTLAELDAAAPNHAAYLTAKSLHAGWANTAALRRGATRSDPPGGALGRMVRISNGLLFETFDGACLMRAPVPNPCTSRKSDQQAQENLWRVGLTGYTFRPANFSWPSIAGSERSIKLKYSESACGRSGFATGLGLGSGFGDMLRIGSIRLCRWRWDRAAAMLQRREPDNRGCCCWMAKLYEHGRAAVEWAEPGVHAIGDLSSRDSKCLHNCENMAGTDGSGRLTRPGRTPPDRACAVDSSR